MSRNPFKPATDQTTEFGFGPGHFPNPNIDYSLNGMKSRIPVEDPDRQQQYLTLMAAKRTDLNDPNVPDMAGFNGNRADHADFYTEGNTERYGANPPLVQQRRQPPPKVRKYTVRPHMERQA
jgi:hypothetical protein